MKYNILAVDDEKSILSSIKLAFKNKYNVFCAIDGKESLNILKNENINLVFLDLGLPDTDGLKLIKEIKKLNPFIEVIIITAKSDIETAISAIKKGAFDYVLKPYDIERLSVIAEKAIESSILKNQVTFLKLERANNSDKNSFLGCSNAAYEIRSMIDKLKSTNSTILISGESGTGKEVVANALHYSGNFKNAPFVPIHAGALSAGIIESELFGYEKGSFTGANSTKIGKFEYANEGTIFFDEISTMPESLQIKLLRVLQERSFTRVGGTKPVHVKVRIIAASNVDLQEEVDKGNFRFDLFYRLNVVHIKIPPLRERKEDIPELANHFIKCYSRELRKNIDGITNSVLNIFNEYSWPGNVRELGNVIERAIVLATGNYIETSDIPFELMLDNTPDYNNVQGYVKNAKEKMKLIEIENLYKTLKNCQWNRSLAASELGVHRNTILNKIKKYKINKENE